MRQLQPKYYVKGRDWEGKLPPEQVEIWTKKTGEDWILAKKFRPQPPGKDDKAHLRQMEIPFSAEGVEKILKPGKWNSMRIKAVGPKYEVWINGTKVLSYEDPSSPNPGPIGLQVHGGLKMRIEFRNLRAMELGKA